MAGLLTKVPTGQIVEIFLNNTTLGHYQTYNIHSFGQRIFMAEFNDDENRF
jgi:hypothetical protein